MNSLYGLSYTLKIHMIQDHLADMLRDSGETLRDTSDEHTENVHHRLREFKETHQYGVSMRKLGDQCQQSRQQNLISHWNSLNIC